jgi:hypothetical protein
MSTPQRRLTKLSIGFAMAAILTVSSAARAGLVTLGEAANYAVLQYNDGTATQMTFSISGGSTAVTGNNLGLLGSAANTNVNFSGMAPTIPLWQSSVNTGGNNYNGVTPVTGPSVDTSLALAVSNAITASNTYAGLTPTLNVSGAVTSTQNNSFTGNGGVNVIDLLGGINLTGSTGITITGTPNDTFVFNVDTKFTSNNGASTTLVGVTAGQIIWNYVGTIAMNLSDASFTGGNHGDTWDGTILSQHAGISAHDRTFNGALISGQDISITSNPVVNFVPFTPGSPEPPPVPEPATIVGALSGLVPLGLAVLLRLRRRRVK